MDVEIGNKRGCGGREVDGGAFSQYSAAQGETRAFRAVWVVIACMTFPMLAFVSGVYRPPLALLVGAYHGRSQQRAPLAPPPPQPEEPPVDRADTVFYGIADSPRDKYLGGLLAAGFDEDTCQSRYQSTMYRKVSPHKPSPYLLQKLRKYEQRHRRCAPYTAGYNSTLPFLINGLPAPEKETECKYILWAPWSGLGNRILSLTSSFLYALLTDRVVLIDRGKDMTSLFCEPFPDTTWLLPPDFPITNFDVYNANHPLSYGNLLRNKNISTTDGGAGSTRPPSFVYLNLPHDYNTEDMHFFCEPDQAVLKKVPWLFARTNNYIVPGFFLNQEFEPELSRMFPEKETVFHHLGRYLFHPTNDVWGMVTRYYKSYMATARERLGIQIRVFNSKDAPFEVVAKQVVNCTLQEGLLPKLDAAAANAIADPAKTTKSVLITSLYTGYFEKLKDMYWEHPAAGGVTVSVHQPTHEEWQQTDKESHDLKAWAEMNLLSLADVLVTSAWSTFGYMGQGLGGITPWILLRPEGGKVPQPACVRETSIDPCFHSPPWYVCRERRNGDNGKVVPFVTHCTDVKGGIKLVDRTE